jgi:hypothetical protein
VRENIPGRCVHGKRVNIYSPIVTIQVGIDNATAETQQAYTVVGTRRMGQVHWRGLCKGRR